MQIVTNGTSNVFEVELAMNGQASRLRPWLFLAPVSFPLLVLSHPSQICTHPVVLKQPESCQFELETATDWPGLGIR